MLTRQLLKMNEQMPNPCIRNSFILPVLAFRPAICIHAKECGLSLSHKLRVQQFTHANGKTSHSHDNVFIMSGEIAIPLHISTFNQ